MADIPDPSRPPEEYFAGELRLLAGFLSPEEQRRLSLPLPIEVGGTHGETLLRCQGPVEEKVVARILEMLMACRQEGITLYRPQLARLRSVLVTTTRYVFVIRGPSGGEEG